jgi:SAM-dependent methyltransferase
MASLSTQAWHRVRAEESRVRRAYARRRERLLDRENAWSNPHFIYRRQDRERQVLAWLRRLALPFDDTRALDVGCGSGAWLRDLVRWGFPPEHLWGVDLLPHFIADAHRRCPTGVHVQCGSATHLPFKDGAFDLVIQATLFTSLLDAEVRRVAAAELLRVVRQGGVILWYDFFISNPRNPDVRRVGKRELRALFPHCRLTLRKSTLAPPLARRVAPLSHMLYQTLARLPFLCTHYLGVIRPVPA